MIRVGSGKHHPTPSAAGIALPVLPLESLFFGEEGAYGFSLEGDHLRDSVQPATTVTVDRRNENIINRHEMVTNVACDCATFRERNKSANLSAEHYRTLIILTGDRYQRNVITSLPSSTINNCPSGLPISSLLTGHAGGIVTAQLCRRPTTTSLQGRGHHGLDGVARLPPHQRHGTSRTQTLHPQLPSGDTETLGNVCADCILCRGRGQVRRSIRIGQA